MKTHPFDRQLREHFTGILLRPGDPDYETTRKLWNGAIDKRPALIARCVGVDDVVAAVRFGSPLVDLIRPTAYTAHQAMFDPTLPHSLRYYWKSHYLTGLSDAVIDRLAAHAWAATSPLSYTIIFQLGGAICRAADEDTAFTGRDAAFALNINGACTEADDYPQQVLWVRDLWEATLPFARGVNMNFLGDEGQDRVRAAYGSEKYARLSALKRRYNPTNFFRMNRNIPPSP